MKKIYGLIITFVILTVCATGMADENKFLSDRHIEQQGLGCADCHQGIESPEKPADIQACLDCHGGYEGMAEATADEDEEGPNPHDSHEGELECSMCHRAHSEPVSYCDSCHAFGLIVP